MPKAGVTRATMAAKSAQRQRKPSEYKSASPSRRRIYEEDPEGTFNHGSLMSKTLGFAGRPLHMDPEEAASKSQRWWKGVRLKNDAREILKKKAHMRRTVEDRFRELCIYVVFLLIYTYSTLAPLLAEDFFYFQENIRNQLTGVEFLPEHSPTWPKAFFDIATVQEFHQWMQGPFHAAVWTSGTFDGDDAYQLSQNMSRYTLGYGRKLGGVRVGQLRVKSRSCDKEVGMSELLFQDPESFTCYGSTDNIWTEESELTTAFGEGGGEQFTFKGWNNTDTLWERNQPMTYELLDAKSTRNVLAPAFSVVLPNRGAAEAKRMINYLIGAKYVDLHTKVVLIDLNVYNVQLNQLAAVRMIAQMTKAGGVLSSYRSRIVPMNPFPFMPGVAIGYSVTGVLAALFYVYYIGMEFYKCRRGARYRYKKCGGPDVVHLLNILFYLMSWAFLLYAWSSLPNASDAPGGDASLTTKVPSNIDADEYIHYRSYVEIAVMARYMNALNTFLSWFKMVMYLSIFKKFAIVTGTMSNAAVGTRGFIVVFLIILVSFIVLHQMMFGSELNNFRDFTASFYTLLLSLLGDFDFSELRESHWFFGPVAFLIFVFGGQFVTFNILIAIISDAYTVTKDQLEAPDRPDYGTEMGRHVRRMLVNLPCCGRCCRSFTRWLCPLREQGRYARILRIQSRPKFTSTRHMVVAREKAEEEDLKKMGKERKMEMETGGAGNGKGNDNGSGGSTFPNRHRHHASLEEETKVYPIEALPLPETDVDAAMAAASSRPFGEPMAQVAGGPPPGMGTGMGMDMSASGRGGTGFGEDMADMPEFINAIIEDETKGLVEEVASLRSQLAEMHKKLNYVVSYHLHMQKKNQLGVS